MTPFRTRARLAALGVHALLLAASLVLPVQARAQRPSVEAARWLVGCWERAGTRGRSTIERWEAPRNGMMLGAAYAVTPAIVRENEQLRLFRLGDTLVYEAHPGNQARTAFGATRVTPNELVFENPAHDFPQRIVYRRVGRDSLIARIEGDSSGRRAPVTFAFARVACGRVPPSGGLAARVELQAMYDAMASAEQRSAGGRMLWNATRAAPSYRYVIWTEPGSDVQALDAAGVRLAASQQAAIARSEAPTGRRYRASVERVRISGDTAEALVEGVATDRLQDTGGRYGPRGAAVDRTTVQRWIDTWVRVQGTWRLAATALIAEEIHAGGAPRPDRPR